MLPYTDGGAPELLIDRTGPWDATGQNAIYGRFGNKLDGTVRDMPLGGLPFLFCPSNDRHNITPNLFATHYIGSAGLGSDSPELDKTDPRAGLFGYNRRTSLDDIPEGESNVMMVFETALDNGPWVAGGRPTVRGLEKEKSYFGPTGQCGSFHTTQDSLFGRPFSVSNFAMLDGSVRLLTEKTDSTIIEELATLGTKPNSQK
jgi:hypothetical protein